jgi:hypothetical protein
MFAPTCFEPKTKNSLAILVTIKGSEIEPIVFQHLNKTREFYLIVVCCPKKPVVAQHHDFAILLKQPPLLILPCVS